MVSTSLICGIIKSKKVRPYIRSVIVNKQTNTVTLVIKVPEEYKDLLDCLGELRNA